MKKTELEDSDILRAHEKGQLKSVSTSSELAKFKAAARATGLKDRRVNIRMSADDRSDMRVRANAKRGALR